MQFYFTEVDLRQWEESKDSRDKSVFDRRRYYLINWQEKRLFRNKRVGLGQLQCTPGSSGGVQKTYHESSLNFWRSRSDSKTIDDKIRASLLFSQCQIKRLDQCTQGFLKTDLSSKRKALAFQVFGFILLLPQTIHAQSSKENTAGDKMGPIGPIFIRGLSNTDSIGSTCLL